MTVLRRVGVALTSFMFALVLSACAGADDSALKVHTSEGSFDFKVEIADTNEERSQGLMFREHLAPDDGMLFDFKSEREAAFWMVNTLIPLDMIFIGSDGIVRNVHVNARPLDRTSIPSAGPVQFVLEIPGGRSLEIGLEAGDRIEHALIQPDQ